ncbi:60S ribosomal protein L35 [Tupaia chinensis]|uniref:Large ribosomal subunit protein uL29 n=1 Tax=Tupaia chinensis TaxID=246437 RepID=L9KWR7_TUPCH|nr:60S ribosomal protein L35 [Tupaia chinensis]
MYTLTGQAGPFIKASLSYQANRSETLHKLPQLRVVQVTGVAARKLSKIRAVRKSIARVLTVINWTQKTSGNSTRARSTAPDLWPKESAAVRWQRNVQNGSLGTEKQPRKEPLYPLWFPVKA